MLHKANIIFPPTPNISGSAAATAQVAARLRQDVAARLRQDVAARLRQDKAIEDTIAGKIAAVTASPAR